MGVIQVDFFKPSKLHVIPFVFSVSQINPEIVAFIQFLIFRDMIFHPSIKVLVKIAYKTMHFGITFSEKKHELE